MKAHLSVVSGECSPSVAELSPGVTVTIGRSRDNVMVIKDDLASRLHAKVYYEDGRWLLRDFGLNGTRVSGKRVTGVQELQDGAELQIGQVKIKYQVGSAKEDKNILSSDDANPNPKGKDRGSKTNHQVFRETVNIDPAQLIASQDDTSLRADELTALVNFMTSAVANDDLQDIIRNTLRTMLNQTSATVVGFMSLDPAEPTPKLILPERANVDVSLSRRLTEIVRETKKYVWLFGKDKEQSNPAASLTHYNDAVCLPVLGNEGEPVAALHAYRSGRGFFERDVRFLEAVASFLSPALENLRNRRKLEADNSRLRNSAFAAEELIGDSNAMMNLRQQISRVAPMPFTVLIQGESGSGKELVALALHKNSQRVDGPLVVVNCAGFAPSLLEAELFGYQRGAFAGADHDHPGFFEQADEGTIYLDEVADLSPECQAKLLRVIEGKSFRPLGGTRDITVDVRVIAATTRDLDLEVKAGRFRQDLLFRLKVILFRVPPLREHAEDISELARFFLERLSVQCHRQFKLSTAAENKLLEYSWPGNVRQLRAVLESAAVMSESDLIDVESLPLVSASETNFTTASSLDLPASINMDDVETWAITKALKQTGGNVSQAAKVLGISRDTLHTKLKAKNIDRKALSHGEM